MFLISQVSTGQINQIKYELQSIQQERLDVMEECQEVLETYGQDSTQYQEATAQANVIDTELEMEQNQLQVSLQMLQAWRESEEDETKQTNDRIFGK